MLSTLRNLSDLPSISADLADFLISQTPDKRIGTTTIDTNHLKNGCISDLAAACLNDQEQRQFAMYTFEKRRHQWLMGRICAKQSVLKLIDCTDDGQELTPADIVIEVAPSGRPFLSAVSANLLIPAPDISISHSERKIIALAANGFCGIDIQVLTDTLFKVKSRFCSEKENTLLYNAVDDELTQLGLLWVAKEAARKCFSESGTIGFLAMELSAINHRGTCSFLELQLDRSCAGVDVVTVAAAVADDHCLGACIVPRETDHA